MDDDQKAPRLAIAVLGMEEDYGYWIGREGRSIVLGRTLAPGRGATLAQRLSEVEPTEALHTTVSARAYAAALSARLAALGEARAGVDLLVLHEEAEGLGGLCIGSAGVWATVPEIGRATPDRSVGAQLRALNVAVDARTEHLSTTRILASGVEGGDVFYAVGTRAVAVVGWPLPELRALPPAELGGDVAEVLGTLTRLVTRQCASGSGLIAVWERTPPEAADASSDGESDGG